MNEKLNACNLLCPLPVIRTQNQIKKMQPGETLEVICTDPGTQQDIPAWCRINGHQITEQKQVDNQFHFTIMIGQD